MSLAAAKDVIKYLEGLASGECLPITHTLEDTLANAGLVYAQLQKYEATLRNIATTNLEKTEVYMRRIAFEALDD